MKLLARRKMANESVADRLGADTTPPVAGRHRGERKSGLRVVVTDDDEVVLRELSETVGEKEVSDGSVGEVFEG